MEKRVSEIKYTHSTNQDRQTYIDSLKKERAEYPEQKTLHSKNITNITVDIYSVTPHKEKIGIQEDRQEDCNIHFNKNEANNSMNANKTVGASKKIGTIAIKTVEINAINTIEQIVREQK